MRTSIVSCFALLLGGCAVAAEPTASVPLTWTGDFGEGGSPPGHIALLLDEVGDTWRGTMYFESREPGGDLPRVTYRIEGVPEEGVVRIVQKEILQADPLESGAWCRGTYELSLDEREGATKGLSGAYSGGSAGCTGSTALSPADSF
jgi:hypothetical protein